jgi:glucose-6-phosphate isomerase
MVIWDELSKAVGNDAGQRIIATTDPEKGTLRSIARDKGFRTLPIPPGVGGRYSVLSPVGLLLAEVIGVDTKEMLRGAADISAKCSDPEIWKNPAYVFGVLLYLMDHEEKKNINVMVPYADGLKYLAQWFSQLWAESLGKLGMGMTPYPSLGTVDQHSQLQLWMEGPEDKVFIFIRVLDFGADITIPEIFKDRDGIGYLGGHRLSELIKAEGESTELALTKNKRPNMTIHVPRIDAYHIGQLFQFFEIATAFAGFLYGVNPFNQPGVEEGKNFTYGMMGKKGFEGRREEVEKAREKKICYRL